MKIFPEIHRSTKEVSIKSVDNHGNSGLSGSRVDDTPSQNSCTNSDFSSGDSQEAD